MKKLGFYFILPLMMLASSLLVGCSDDNGDDPVVDNSGDDTTDDTVASDTYFDIWVSLDGTGDGMSTGATMLVSSLESLDDVDSTIDFVGVGADVSSSIHDETLIKDGYYYQIPQTEGRFGKYKIENDLCTTIKEVQLPEGAVLAARKYCGDWIDDDTLVIMGSINSYQDIAWVKINTTDMTILGSGTLDLDMDDLTWANVDAGYTLSTSGLVRYREADGKLIYSYSVKRAATAETTSKISIDVSVAFIDPSDMSIEKTVTDSRIEQTSGTAFGELLMTTTFFTESGDYYISCRNSTNITTDKYQSGFIRINAGTTEIDSSYLGLYELDEKLISMEYLGGDEVLLYAQNPSLTLGGSDWSSSLYSCYFSIWNIVDNTRVELSCDGAKLPYCSGNLTTQLFTATEDNAYIGVNAEDFIGVYVYDIDTKSVAKGSAIASGYELLRIVAHE
ncbi:MAG: hypothetical protein SNH55_06380 [Rikenellaceae bacterium]